MASPQTGRRRRRRIDPGPSGNGHLAEVRAAEEAVAEVESARERLRGVARQALGVTGTEGAPPLRESIRRSGVGWYPLVALGLLVMVDEFQGYALTVLGPEVAAGLGLSKSALAGALALKTLAITLALLPMAAYVQRRPRRAAVSIATAFAWSVLTMGTGFVVTVWGLLFVMVADGATTGSVRAVHQPLLVDSYPTDVRVRGLSFYRGADAVGNVLGPVLVGVCTAVLGLTWRGVFVVLGILCVMAAAAAVRLRDPGFGRWDADKAREALREETGGTGSLHDEDVELGFFEIAQRLLLVPTIRRVLVAFAVLGMLLVPFTTYQAFFLQERWGLGPGSRAAFFAAMPFFAMAALAAFGRRGEDLFRRDPARLVRLAGVALGSAVVALTLAIVSPLFALTFLFFGAFTALVAVMLPALNMVVFSIIPSHMRPHMAALSGIALAAVGGGGGLLLLGGIDRRFGTAGAIVSLAVPGVVAGLVLRTAARTVDDDLDRMVDEIVEEEEIRALRGRGERLPMLACRHVDFSYGQLQVLFDVNFTVDDGEIVALLGTNGAGKSTLLRVVSGLGLPSRGTVRFRGADVTYLDAERRLRLGITQIPGGRAVFGPMTVVENLRVLAYSHGGNRRAVEAGLDASFEAFPRLAERRNQLASTLSGGEQQMLGLATAFILRPRLLLIDELSLGLAPKVVGELLDMVRRINAEGTAVVLVEQSVNVALSVVDHAYFMEKGEIRFDGRAADLLGRRDLLRSVFLEGARQAMPSKNGH
ncbi:MAG TPA: MFS transporter [Acidimicrobiales bacterium]|nr:MFS transporter [Acidimicrobiales bacterium]